MKHEVAILQIMLPLTLTAKSLSSTAGARKIRPRHGRVNAQRIVLNSI
jgi:hypothetical protein